MTRTRARISRRLRSDERGFALVEVVVSAVVLVAMALGTFTVMDQAGQRSGSNRARGAATSLAEQDQDRMRVMPLTTLANLDQTQTKNQNGFDFSIRSQAEWVSDSSGVVSCSTTTGGNQYLRITSTVTWPKMNGVDPVVVESFVTPKAADVNKGTLVVTLQNAAGGPQPNVPVTAQSTTRNTDSGGCALFTDLAPGVTNITWTKSGHVDTTNNPVGSATASIVSGETAVKSGQYDLAATIPTAFKDTTLPTAANRSWTSATVKSGNNPAVRVTGSAPTFTGLFPFTVGYSVYAGNCDGNEPTQYGNATYFTTYSNAFASVTPGGTTATRHAILRRVSITVSRTSMRRVAWLVKPDGDSRMAGCPNPTTSGSTSFGSAVNSTVVNIDLPYGLYDICVESQIGSPANTPRSRWMNNTNAANGSTTNNTVYYNTPTGSTGGNVPGLAAKTANHNTSGQYASVVCS